MPSGVIEKSVLDSNVAKLGMRGAKNVKFWATMLVEMSVLM